MTYYALAFGMFVGWALTMWYVYLRILPRVFAHQTYDLTEAYTAGQSDYLDGLAHDPRIRVTYASGVIVADMTVWEWVARAALLHHIPPADLDELVVYIADVKVERWGT